jgi:glycosyltransferase involved in cell wall biosynthesis
MRNPLVSVMLPFLNAGSAFAPALRSILNQSYENWELLLCDDGSRDGSLELARGLRDPRVVVWSDGETKGLAARLNECIARARGELIARMDADDISFPDRLRQQVEYLEQHPEVDLVGASMLVCAEDGAALGKRLAPPDHAAIVAHPALGFATAHPTWMARAAWYRRFQYDASAVRFEDVELLYRSHACSRFANLPQVLYGYREMRGGFEKRRKTRLGRIAYLRSHQAEWGRSLYWKAAVTERVKLLLDAGLDLLSARYLWLRWRERKLTAAEAAQWRELLAGLESPELRPAARLAAQEGARA